jgi:hypothetical protein
MQMARRHKSHNTHSTGGTASWLAHEEGAVSHAEQRPAQAQHRAHTRFSALAWPVVAIALVIAAVPAFAQYAYRRPITVDRTKVANPTTLPIAFDNVTSAITANAGASNLSWSHNVGSGTQPIAIVSVSSKRDAGGAITLDNTTSATTGTGSATSLTFSHGVGSGSNRLAVVSVATGPGVLSITNDTSTSANNGTGTTNTLTWSHTTNNQTNRILIVGVSIRNTTGQTVVYPGGVTYNGVALTRLGVAQYSGTTARMEMWYMLAPPVNTYTVSVTLTAAAAMVGGSATFYNVDQVAPTGFVSNFGSSYGTDTAYVDVPSAPGELVVDTVAQQSSTSTLSTGSGQTNLWLNVTNTGSNSANVRGGGSYEAGATNVRMSWTISGTTNRNWAVGAIPLRPATTTVPTISSVTYAGTSMTSLGSVLNSGNCRVSLYSIQAPANASNTVIVTLSGPARFSAAALSFNNVSQTTSTGTFSSATGNSTAALTTVASAAGDVVLDVVAHRDGTYTLTADPSQTPQWTQLAQDPGNAANSMEVAGSTKAGATSTTMTWTITGTAQWAIGAVPIKPATPPVTITQVMFGTLRRLCVRYGLGIVKR